MEKQIKNKKENGNLIVTLKLNGNEWTTFIKEATKKLNENLEVKGFRKGKVPQEIAKKHISSNKVLNEAINIAIDKNSKNVFENIKDEQTISRPEVSIAKVSDSEAEINFTFALAPEIKIGNFKEVKIKYEVPKVEKEELDTQLEQLKPFFKDTVEEDKIVENNDTVNIDFVGKVNGKEFEGGKSENFDLKIGSKSFIDNFEDQLIGMKKGDKKTITVKFPEEYPSKELKGKEANFDVKINSVKVEKDLSNEEINKKLKPLGYENKDDLIKKMKLMLEEQKEQQAKDTFFKEFVKEVTSKDDSEINIPEILLNQEIDKELKNFSSKLEEQNLNMKQYLEMISSTIEDFKEKNLKPQVQSSITEGLVYQYLIKELDIKVTDKDYTDEIEKIAKQQSMKVEDVEKQIQRQSVEGAMQFNKLIDILIK